MDQLVLQKNPPPPKVPVFLWMALAVFVLNLLIYGLAHQRLQSSRDLYQQRAAVKSQNVTSLLEQSIADSIERIDLSLLYVRDEIDRQMAEGRGIDKVRLNAYINRLHSRLPDLEGLRVTDEAGTVRYGVNVSDDSDVSIAQDEHFPYLRDNPDAGTVISRPKFGKISKRWTIKVVRRYNRADGSFGGLISGIIDLNYFGIHFAALSIGESGSITLRDREMGIVVRYPQIAGADKAIGQKNISIPYQDALAASPYKGTFVEKSMVDGLVRTVSYRAVGRWPLHVQAELAEEDYLAEWRSEARNVLTFVGVFTLLSLLLGVIGQRYWRNRRLAAETLEDNRKLFRTFAEMSADWFWEMDRHFRFTHISGKIESSFGVRAETFIGKTRQELEFHVDHEKQAAHLALLLARQPFRDYEYTYRKPDGEIRNMLVSGIPVVDADGKFHGYRGFGRDVTENRRNEDRIRYLAEYDNLTNLPNRTLFNDRLDQALSLARRNQQQFALLYLDLDKFKPVNDKYGHHAGDLLLRQVASRIKGALRDSDTVARLGGDEFAVLMPKLDCLGDVVEVARKILAAIEVPFDLENVRQPVSVGVSIGISIFPKDADNKEDMVRAADSAMYKAKQVEGNAFRFHDEQYDAQY